MTVQGRLFLVYSSAALRRCRSSAFFAGHHCHEQQIRFVTSAQKRALNEEQIVGAPSKAAAAAPIAAPPSGIPSMSMPLILAVAGAGVYILDQKNMLDGIRQSLGVPKKKKEEEQPKETKQVVVNSSHESTTIQAEPQPEQNETVKEEAIPEAPKVPEIGVSVDHMAAVGFPPAMVNATGTVEEFVEGIVHPESGNRVTMEQFPKTNQPVDTAQQSLTEELGSVASLPSTVVATLPAPIIIHTETPNTTTTTNLEDLSLKELRERISLLSLELDHRTNWEGIRMAQFRKALEQELSHKHMEELHKQRLEFEELMSSKIRVVQESIEKRSKALLADKEQEVEQLLEAAKHTLSQEHEAEMQAELENWNREFQASLQQEVAKQVSGVKEQYAKELAEKVALVQQITQKLEYLEHYAEMSRTYEQSSKSAHKISAAALALANKLESTGKSALAEIEALRNAVHDEDASSGISVALEQLPDDVTKGARRVPTVSELQANFTAIKRRARAASKVPEGKHGLGAQLFSYVFSAITVEPEDDSSDSQQDSYIPDLVLARAGKFVQLGDLESAVNELNGLKGQAAFTVKDWKQDATNRVMVNRMLKVIKMECSLLNESLSD